MKRIAVLAGALLTLPLLANAQSPGFYVAGGGGLNHVSISGTSGEKLGYNLTGIVGYDFIGPMVEVEGAYRNNGVHSANLNQYTGMLNALYNFNPRSKWSFHAGLGIGFDVLSASHGYSQNSTNFAVQGLIGMKVDFGAGYFARTDLKFMNVFNSGSDAQNLGGTITVGYKF